MRTFILNTTLLASAVLMCASTFQDYRVDESLFVIHIADPSSGKLKLYWKNAHGEPFGSLENLKKSLAENEERLVFAMNGGMYLKDQSPQGIFIEDGKTLVQMDRRLSGYGNFYLQPNGVFSITKEGKASVVQTSDFEITQNINYATQSGPMLLIDGFYHHKLILGSTNLHIRNGVGVLPNGEVMFAMSREKVSFYDLATLFKQNGCRNALYLDGFVSKTYLPSSDWIQLDGNFGVIIGEVN